MEQLNVLLTGASGGIGYELAKQFARKNCNLILVGRNRERLEAIRSELSAGDIKVTIIEKDLMLPGAAEEVYREAVRTHQRVHILVNNAGIGMYGSFDKLPLERQMQMVHLNIAALTELTHFAAKGMVEMKFGRILNIGSVSSFLPTPMMSVYAATKAYVLSFSETLNSELSRKWDIRVIALCPGFTNTGFIKKAGMGSLEKLVSRIALSPAAVAIAGARSVRRGSTVRVVGGLNLLLAIMNRLLPRAIIQMVAKMVLK